MNLFHTQSHMIRNSAPLFLHRRAGYRLGVGRETVSSVCEELGDVIWVYFSYMNSAYSWFRKAMYTVDVTDEQAVRTFACHIASKALLISMAQPGYFHIIHILRKDFAILQLYWWLFNSTKQCI